MSRAVLVTIAAVILLALAALALFPRGSDDEPSSRALRATGNSEGGAAERFLSTYVDADGRVVREDQGGDTVSEGQAYALMLAVATGDDATFDRVWTWTRDNLQRDDGLFAWHWADGEVVDDSPAADADLDIAAALAAGAERFGQDELRDEAGRIADAAMEHETAPTDGGRVLVAGPWAVEDRVVNPSYLARCDYDQLAELSGDERWREVGETGLGVLDALLEDGLPPDWAVVASDGRPTPVASADDSDGPGRYGLDAARVPILLATCDDGRPHAARMWERLGRLDADGAGIAYDLDGSSRDQGTHPLGLVAAAAAAHADGDAAASRRLLREAERLDEQQPTYYGAAWVAFGQLWLSDHDEDQGAVAPAVGIELASAVQEQPTTTEGTTSTTVAGTTTTPTTDGSTTSTTGGSSSTTERPPTSPTSPTGGSSTTTPTTAPAAPGASSTTTSTTAPAETGDLSGEDGAQEVLGGAGDSDGGSPDEPTRRRTGALALGGAIVTIALGAVLGLRERRVNLLRS